MWKHWQSEKNKTWNKGVTAHETSVSWVLQWKICFENMVKKFNCIWEQNQISLKSNRFFYFKKVWEQNQKHLGYAHMHTHDTTKVNLIFSNTYANQYISRSVLCFKHNV